MGSGPFDNISSELVPGGAPPVIRFHGPPLFIEDHAAQEPGRNWSILFLRKQQFYGFETAPKPVSSSPLSAELGASGEKVVLLSIAGTFNDVRARIAVPVFRQVKL